MRQLSNHDYDTLVRVLWWAAVQGDGSTRAREWRRKAQNLARKMERKQLSTNINNN